jgi:hypothetical protein
VLDTMNGFLTRYDPAPPFTDHGDTVILPLLPRLARRHGIALALDRGPMPITRRIVTEGRSFFTYGRTLYHPPDYPLYGRWHIDRAHSFVYQETGLRRWLSWPACRCSGSPAPRSAPFSPPCNSTWRYGGASSPLSAKRSRSAGRWRSCCLRWIKGVGCASRP